MDTVGLVNDYPSLFKPEKHGLFEPGFVDAFDKEPL